MLTKSSRDPSVTSHGAARNCDAAIVALLACGWRLHARSQAADWIASGDDEGRAAGWRKRCDAARDLRLELVAGPNRTTRWQNDGRRIELRNDASGQMLEHLALETVVIGRVSRAAWNIGRLALVLMRRRRRRGMRVRSLLLRGVVDRRQVHPDPRQETQGRPGQREQRVRRDPRAPATAARRVAP